MADGKKDLGEKLFSSLKGKGLSRGQIQKVLVLQRLGPEVSELGDEGLFNEAQLVEASRTTEVLLDKYLDKLAKEHTLPTSWVRELSRIIRLAERAEDDTEANSYWDFFFEVTEQIEQEGAQRPLLDKIRDFHPDDPLGEEESGDLFDDEERRIVPFSTLNVLPGRGLDVGTVNICGAAKAADGSTHFNIQRDAFLDVRCDKYTRKMLMKLGIDYLVQGDKGFVVGDPAFELANIFEKATRRPMKDGMISPLEPEALMIVSLLIAKLLGKPSTKGELCAYSIPSDPIDVDRNVVYHRGALESVLRKLGYEPKSILEGHAVVFAELQEQDYTGLGISCGGGMFNVCVAYKGLPALSFSTSRGGDWVDNNVAHALGMPTSMVCTVKEGGIDLQNPTDRVEDAIAIYYRNLIDYTLETICRKFESARQMPHFSRPVDLVCAGGTSMIKGFIEIFKEEFRKVDFPVRVGEIRMAQDPLRTVAAGCLQAAIEEIAAMEDTEIHDVPLERAEVTAMDKFATEVRERLGGAVKAPPQAEPPSPPPPPAPKQDPEPPPPTMKVEEASTEPPEDPYLAEVDRQMQGGAVDGEVDAGSVYQPERKLEAAPPDGEVDPGDVSEVARELKEAPEVDTSGSAPRLSSLESEPAEVSVPQPPARKIPPPSTEEPDLEEVEPGVFRPASPKAGKDNKGDFPIIS